MPPAPATRLGPYEILAEIGAGGMGQVFRARDTRLDRTVAIKVLLAKTAEREESRQRFEREARAVSSLNHPHICTLYDIGNQDGIDYLVMEYLDGDTLAHRLKNGPILLDQTLRYAIEIADALDHAHRHGVIHRDFKPGNIMLTKAGSKLLDFGLARLHANPDASKTAATRTLTQEGAILGTFQYMAPEQLEGKDADARTDIFAFGAVLYEMLTGRKAFAGESQASLIAAIMEREPRPISELQPTTPLALDRVIRRCLAKDPDERWQSARDLLLELKWIVEQGAPSKGKERAPRLKWPLWAGVAAVGVLAAAAGGFWVGRSKEAPEAPEMRYLTSSGHDSSPAASPDGKTVAFSSDRDGSQRIWLKELARGDEIALTTGRTDTNPRFSPDGSMILFARGDGSQTSLYRVATLGGEPRKLIPDADAGDWSPDGRQIVFIRQKPGGGTSELFVANSEGSQERQVAQFEGFRSLPRWSPDGRTIAVAEDRDGVYSVLVTGPDGTGRRSLSAPPGAFFIPSLAWQDNDIVYLQHESPPQGLPAGTGGGTRLIRQNSVSGAPRTFLRIPNESWAFDILGSGRLVFDEVSRRQSLRETYLPAKTLRPSRLLTKGASQDREPAYSPDGEWVIFTSTRSGNKDIWKISTQTGALHRLTDEPAEDWDPAFMPDGKNIIWSSNRTGHFEIWIAEADGSGARQVTHDSADNQNPTATRDGNWIVYSAKQGVWKIHQDGSGATRLSGGYRPEVSPDGQYTAFGDTGGYRFVRIADSATVPFEVHGAGRMRWMPDGHAVAFVGKDEKGLSGVLVQDFIPGQDTIKTRRKLAGFDPGATVETFGISADGSRITISVADPLSSLMVADRVPGITPPARRSR